MKINEETLKGKWLEIKGDIQRAWGKINSDELEETKGELKSLAGLVMQKYGENQEKFQRKLSEILEAYSSRPDIPESDARSDRSEKTEQVGKNIKARLAQKKKNREAAAKHRHH